MTPRFCYVVLCHTRADAVARLVRRIRALSPHADVLVRFGREADLDPRPLEAAGASVLRSELRTRWGDWSLVEAELECYTRAREFFDADYYVLVSGQDVPIRDLATWEQEVAAGRTDAVLGLQEPAAVTVDNRWRVVDGPALPAAARRVLVKAAWWVTRAAHGRLHLVEAPKSEDHRWWIGLPRPRGRRQVVKASQWKVLSRRAVDVLLERHRSDPEEVAFFQACKVPDELYVASVLASAPGVRVVDDWVAWARFPEGAVSPLYLDEGLVHQATASGSAFARKLHPDAPAAVVAATERACAR